MARTVTVDFAGVEVGGGRIRVPEGDYGLKLVEIKGKKSAEDKPYLAAVFVITKGNAKGIKKKLSPHTFSLQKQSLWNLRNFLEACGKQVPSKAIKIDLDKMIGYECAATLIDDEYEGKKKSVISAFFPMADLGSTSDSGDELEEAPEGEEEEAEEELEEAPKKPAKKAGKSKPKEEEVEESDEEELFS